MTKQKNSRLKLMTSIALAAILCFSIAAPAFAQPIRGTEDNPAEAAITKVLLMGEGTTTPELTFSFEITSVSVDGKEATDTNMPVIGDKEVKFSADKDGITENGVKIVRIETESLFEGVEWPHAGEFVFTVVETQKVPQTITSQETLLFSQAEYKVTAYVANGEEGLYVAIIVAEVVKKDGEDGAEVGEKVDPRPGGDPEVGGDFSKMIFTNIYLKTTGEGDPDDHTLSISKEVASGEDGPDLGNREMYFDFEITVTKSNANPNEEQKYKAYVLDESGKVVTSKDNYEGEILTDAHGGYIVFSTGQKKLIHLKHGQWISFVDLEVGASYTVTELARANYTPNYKQTSNGETADMVRGTQNTSLSTDVALITEELDKTDFINIFMTITPTGISVNNLPYIVLIGLGVGSLVGFTAVKSRKRGHGNAA